jgi:predicted ester cyclase
MLNHYDPDAVDRFVAMEYVNHNRTVGDGREANRAFWAGFFAVFPDLMATMDDLVMAGDEVVGRFTYRGTHRGQLFDSRLPAGRSRCTPSTSGGSPAANSPSTGTSSTCWRSSSNSA